MSLDQAKMFAEAWALQVAPSREEREEYTDIFLRGFRSHEASIRSAVEQEIVSWLNRPETPNIWFAQELADAISSGQYRKERG